MNGLLKVLERIFDRLGYAPDDASETERVRAMERRLEALDATIGAQQAVKTHERHRRDREGNHVRP